MLKEISQGEIKMPIMAFLDADMFIKNDEKFIVRKSSVPFYNSNHLTIIDSTGNIFNVDSVELIGKMIWWHFFKDGFYDYYNAYINAKDVRKISLKEFKEKILSFIEQNPKYGWSRIAKISEIKIFIERATSFKQIIDYFIYFKA